MSTSEARLVTAQEVVLGEKGSDLVEQNQYIYIYILEVGIDYFF